MRACPARCRQGKGMIQFWTGAWLWMKVAEKIAVAAIFSCKICLINRWDVLLFVKVIIEELSHRCFF